MVLQVCKLLITELVEDPEVELKVSESRKKLEWLIEIMGHALTLPLESGHNSTSETAERVLKIYGNGKLGRCISIHLFIRGINWWGRVGKWIEEAPVCMSSEKEMQQLFIHIVGHLSLIFESGERREEGPGKGGYKQMASSVGTGHRTQFL